MITILAFLFVLSLLVVIHELGHFSVAKFFGIGVERFSVGLPPKLFGKQIGETEYVISAIPFGGYVKMTGQDDFTIEEDDSNLGPKDFRGKSAPIRAAVLVAGSFMNILAAVAIFFLLFMTDGVPLSTTKIGTVEPNTIAAQVGLQGGDEIVAVNGKKVERMEDVLLPLFTRDRTALTVSGNGGASRQVIIPRKLKEGENIGIVPWIAAKVGEVIPGSAADKAGVKAGDIIASIDTTRVDSWYDMNRVVRVSPGKPLVFTMNRNGEDVKLTITPASAQDTAQNGKQTTIGRIGVKLFVENRKVGPVEAFTQAFSQTHYYVVNTFGFFVKLVSGQMSPKLLGGPVMIAELAGESARSGLATLLGFTAFISINLGVLNLLPFPVLDGGHIFIILVESITRRKLSLRARGVIQQAGTLVLLFLMFYVTFNDLMRIDVLSRLFGGK